MNLGQMQAELGFIVKDDFLLPLLVGWINDAILEVATDYDLPPLRLAAPYELSVADTDWLWTLPESYHKKLFMAKYVDGTNQYSVPIHRNSECIIREDHAITGDNPSMVTVIPQGATFSLACYPMSTRTLNLWFYRKPALLANDGDVCDCIPASYVSPVIYPKLITKNYQFIVDQVIDFSFVAGPFQYWESELRKGLHGAPGRGPGLLGYFNLNFPSPRRTRGRDSTGWRSYRGGL